mgnify:CR=1 FL=1
MKIVVFELGYEDPKDDVFMFRDSALARNALSNGNGD